MTLRFDIDGQSRERTKEGKYLLVKDVKTILLEVRENYEHGINSTRFDFGGYGAIQLALNRLDLL